jgi:hypothetical protein
MQDLIHDLRRHLYVTTEALRETSIRATDMGLPPLVRLKIEAAEVSVEEGRMWLGETLRHLSSTNPYSATRADREIRGEPAVAPESDTMGAELYMDSLPDHLVLRLSRIREGLETREKQLASITDDIDSLDFNPWRIECMIAARYGIVRGRMLLGIAMRVAGESRGLVVETETATTVREEPVPDPPKDRRQLSFSTSIEGIRGSSKE